MTDNEKIFALRSCAEAGNTNAKYILGLMYEEGIGTPINYTEAFSWYEKAAKDGHPGAQCNLAYCYESGKGTELNAVKAVEWYSKAANQGDTVAACNMGHCYYKSIGVNEDYPSAINYYKSAANSGDKRAQVLLLEDKLEKSHDIEAENQLKDLAEQGDSYALIVLGRYYFWKVFRDKENENDAVSWILKTGVECLKQENRYNYEAQSTLFTLFMFWGVLNKNTVALAVISARLAALFDFSSSSRLQLAYEKGLGVIANQERANSLKKRLLVADLKNADHGNVHSILRVASYYKNGNGVPQNSKKYMEYIKMAADRGHPSSMVIYADHLESKLMSALHYSEALALYEKAAAKGYSDAYGTTGMHYYIGRGTPVDYNKAAYWLEKDYLEDNYDNMFAMLTCWVNHIKDETSFEKACVVIEENFFYDMRQKKIDYKKAYDYTNFLNTMANSNYPPAAYLLAKAMDMGYAYDIDYENKVYKKWEDYNLEKNLLVFSADKCGYKTAYPLRGEIEIGDNNEAALKYFEEAAKEGIADGFFYLGKCYEEGIGYKKNGKAALEMYKEAYLRDSYEGSIRYGKCCLKGEFMSAPDYETAFEVYSELEEENCLEACVGLAEMYYEGYGVDVDDEMALKYVNKGKELRANSSLEQITVLEQLRLTFIEEAIEKGE